MMTLEVVIAPLLTFLLLLQTCRSRYDLMRPKRSPVTGKGMSLYDPEAVFPILAGNG
ncbi:hypothetical protein NKJ70_31265 [Mesorhizobium sp. M0092]|uniref:hypothetical protein n=1 Tax=Mesorhizobium sp. M0092 TaxID=2956876 RepID=UPI003338BB59